MTPFFKTLIRSLNQIGWGDLPEAHRRVEELLRDINSNRELLRQEFASHTPQRRQRISRYSTEPSTHYKWFVYKQPEIGYEVWVHEYKLKEYRKPGYAQVPHNHRYWFSSLILGGGFKHRFYDIERGTKEESSFTDINIVGEHFYDKGNVYTLNPDTIHSITDIADPTTTFIISSKAVKQFSEEFDVSTRRIVRHNPFSTRTETGYPFIDQV